MSVFRILITTLIVSFSGSFFGQLDLSFVAEKMDTSINSSYSEVSPVFSNDGSKVYFVRINHPDNRFGVDGSQDIWMSERNGKSWSEAIRLPNTVNLGRYNAIYDVTASGHLVINGIYDKKGNFVKRGLSVVIVGEDGSYGDVAPLKMKGFNKKSDGAIGSVFINDSGTQMFLSFSKARNGKKNRLYISTYKKGFWTSPKKLKGIASNKSDEMPFLSKDGTTLYFASNRDNEKNNYDIYSSQISDINEYRSWSEPVKILGDVSDGDFDGFFILDTKEEYAYFSSVRKGASNADIYRLQVKDIRDYVLMQGFVVNDKTGDKMSPEDPFKLRVSVRDGLNDSIIELQDYRKNEDSTFFEFKLPYGIEYKMIASIDGYKEKPVAIDLTEVYEYRVIKKDAKVTPIPILTVEGNIEFMDYDSTIMNFDSIQLYANDKPIENAIVNADGSYKFTLPTGEAYKIEARKKGNTTFPFDLDVTNEQSQVSKTVNLKLEKVPDIYSYLHALVLSKKDSVPLKREDYVVYIDGQPASFGFVNKDSLGFNMSLEMGKKYFIMIKSEDYIEAHDSVDFRKAKVRQTINKQFYLTPIEVGATVQIENIYFDLGKAILRPESYLELDRLVEFLEDHDHLVIEVSGHTDNKGNAYLNKKLSGDRALSVRKYLIEHGIDEARLTSKGYGFDKPISPNDTEANRAKNRRVEFTILSND